MDEAAESQPFHVLLVEDNPGDARLVREALKPARVPSILHHVEDGTDALAFLRREGRFAAAVRPDLVLLDLNLPRMDGREVLAAVKADPDLASIPVVVLTTSEAEQDIDHCYALKANCFISKPVEIDEFLEAMAALEAFWFGVVQLPSEGGT